MANTTANDWVYVSSREGTQVPNLATQDGQMVHVTESFRLEPSCGAVPHPDQLAETMLMATTAMPPLRDEEVRIPKALVESGKISSLQLEAVAYAVRKFRVDAEAQKPSGFCLGDGTGCGKGRVVAALMLHLWNTGYRRLCWITATPDLLQDARRDLQDLGAGHIPLLDFRRVHRYSRSRGMFAKWSGAWRPPKGRGRPRKASGERKAKRVKKGKGSAAEEEEVSNRVGCSSPSSSSSSGRGSRTRTGKRSKGHHRKNTVKEEGEIADGKVEMDAIVVEGEAAKEEGRGTDQTKEKNIHHHHHHGRKKGSSSPQESLKRGKRKLEEVEGPAEAEWGGEGIVFAAYAILVATSSPSTKAARKSTAVKSRFDQLLEWLRGGHAFVCLDECHKAKHVKVPGRKTSSRTGDLILELSRRLPTAPFLYCSATVAADLDNLAYLERLGLWGPHTPFQDFEAFHNVARLGGTSGMEALAAEMKARGIMVARCLSFKGTAFHVDKIPLTDEQVRLYDRCSGLWQDIISLPSGSLTGMTLYANAQRFFKILLISFKLPTAVKWANSALKAGKSVVFSIWTTMESRMTAAAAGVDDGGGDKVDAGLAEKLGGPLYSIGSSGPRTLLEYTIKKHLEEKDASLCQFYLSQAAELQLPANPLDELIELMGGSSKVAELTGRTKRQEVDSSGRVRLVPRQTNYSGENINVLEQQAFQRGDKLVAVISEAASAGISLHADARAGSGTRSFDFGPSVVYLVVCRQRVMITLELPWSAEKTVQQLGRVHRTNQLSPPSYVLLVTTLLGELRFVSAVARRLVRLGALTRGDRNLAIGVEKITTDTATECSPSPSDWYGSSSPAISAGSSTPSNTCSSPEEDSEDEARSEAPRQLARLHCSTISYLSLNVLSIRGL